MHIWSIERWSTPTREIDFFMIGFVSIFFSFLFFYFCVFFWFVTRISRQHWLICQISLWANRRRRREREQKSGSCCCCCCCYCKVVRALKNRTMRATGNFAEKEMSENKARRRMSSSTCSISFFISLHYFRALIIKVLTREIALPIFFPVDVNRDLCLADLCPYGLEHSLLICSFFLP